MYAVHTFWQITIFPCLIFHRIVHITGELIIQMEELDSHLTGCASSLLTKLDLDVEPKMDSPSDRMIATLRRSWKGKGNKVRIVDD